MRGAKEGTLHNFSILVCSSSAYFCVLPFVVPKVCGLFSLAQRTKEISFFPFFSCKSYSLISTVSIPPNSIC